MTRQQIARMPSRELQVIIRSTNPAGKYWLEYQMARDELVRRRPLSAADIAARQADYPKARD